MKRLFIIMGVIISTLLCSCGKEDTSWMDELLTEVSGEYYLVGYDLSGAPVDVNGDGKATGALLPGLLDIMGNFYGARDFTLDVSVTSDRFREGRAAGRIPCAVKSYRDGYRPDEWSCHLSFDYGIAKDGLYFSNEKISDESDGDREILTRLTEPRVEFTRDLHSDEIRYLTVNCVAKVYDQSTRRYVDGTVALRYVTSPRVTVDDWVVTVQGASADGMVTYTYDLKTGK